MRKYLEFLPRIVNRGGMPLHLIFFVTSRCNLRCEHCFYWRELNKKKRELSLAEIEKVARSMGPLLWLALTGGEPFLRRDLEEIAKTFVRYNRVRHISIPTNGFLPERIVSGVERMVKENPETTFSVTVSFDGLEEMHDKIRGMRGSFKAALKTLKGLKKIKAKNKGVGVVMTFTKTNQHNFKEAYEYLRDVVAPDEIAIDLIRGEPRNPETAEVDIKLYEKIVEQKMEDIRDGKLPYYSFGLMGRLAAARDGVMHKKIVRYKEGRDDYLPCLAGKLSAVLYETGEVHPCELLSESFGNIRDYDYDFKNLWNSEKAHKIRDWISKTKCACTHECFLTTNILFSPQSYPQILAQFIALYGT